MIIRLRRDTQCALAVSLLLVPVYWLVLVYVCQKWFGIDSEKRLDWDSTIGASLYLGALILAGGTFYSFLRLLRRKKS